MHGIVFGELKQYVTARLGAAAWSELLDAGDSIGPQLVRMYGILLKRT